MRRYHITLGASTSARGKVTSASSHCSINGVRMAVEGDSVLCPTCKTQGKIACIGPRIPEACDGKQVALEGDLCICGCAPPPKLKPIQTLRCQVVENRQSEAPENFTSVTSADEDDEFIEKFFSLIDVDGHTVEGFRYDLYVDGSLYAKAADYQNGNTVSSPKKNAHLTLTTWFNIDGASRRG